MGQNGRGLHTLDYILYSIIPCPHFSYCIFCGYKISLYSSLYTYVYLLGSAGPSISAPEITSPDMSMMSESTINNLAFPTSYKSRKANWGIVDSIATKDLMKYEEIKDKLFSLHGLGLV